MARFTERRIRRRTPAVPPETLPGSLHPLLRRVYAQRGIADAAELNLALGGLAAPDGMVDLERAAEVVADATLAEAPTVVVGDYDADGATGTALLVRGLDACARAAGKRANVGYLIPDRFAEGYGLSPAVVRRLAPQRPALLVTVDNGVSSVEGVAAAHAAGMRVVVTDHHLPGPRLPAAEAVVDPNRADDGFPSKHLSGVGVAFYLLLAVRARLAAAGAFTGERPNPAAWLDLVALGTVADLVPLDYNNRILVEQGLRRIRAGAATPGIAALLELAGRDPRNVTAGDLSFAVAPRLNAAGRLDNMAVGVQCLLADDPAEAAARARELDDLNRRRREVEAQMTEEALAAVEDGSEEAGLGLCVAASGWHEGVAGILASRLKERYQRPVVAFAPAEGGGWKGSARSVPGLHIRDLLARMETLRPGLMRRFGGHAMAAGLTLDEARLPEFRALFAETLDEALGGRSPQTELVSDGPLAVAERTLDAASALRDGGPWGTGFPEPLFDGVFHVAGATALRGGHLRLKLHGGEGDPAATHRAIAFGAAARGWDLLEGAVHVAYRMEINRYAGRTELQLRVEHMERAGAATLKTASS